MKDGNKNNKMYDNLVVNLSDHPLTTDQHCLLEKGLNFCPTPREPNLGDIRKDLDKFHLSLKRQTYFNQDVEVSPNNLSNSEHFLSNPIDDGDSSLEEPPFNHHKFRNPSTWVPNQVPASLDAFIICNQRDLAALETKRPAHDNLSHKERIAIAELKANKDIVIKPADKGSAVVVMNRKDYIAEGIRQLSDRRFYHKLETDLTDDHNKLVTTFVTKLHNLGDIDDKCQEYLAYKKPKTSRFYMLPKIHKGTLPPPGRPIVSANSSPTERISQFVDFFLNPLVPTIPSYIRDTTHFLKTLRDLGQVPPNSLLVTLDVSSLYTNIPNNEGIHAAHKLLRQHRTFDDKPSTNHLIEALEMVLSLNNFEFNGHHYIQVGGTAMGTKVAPSFANIFMGDFENKFIYTHPIKPLLWLRYIDDIFAIFNEDEDTVKQFVSDINTCHHSIKFTSEISRTHIHFLDTTVHLSETGEVHTDLYSKPTDSHNYLRYDSAHPHHLKKGIPYSQFLRVRRICTHNVDFDRHARTLGQHFERRGYPTSIISEAYTRARALDRNALLTPDPDKTKPSSLDKLFAVTVYNPDFSGMREVITNNLPILGKHKRTRFLIDKEIVYGHRRNQNLRDQLVRALLPPIPSARAHGIPGRRCLTRGGMPYYKCNYCYKINKSGTIRSHTTGIAYTSRTKVDCKSHNLVYCIECKKCGLQYVGITMNALSVRIGDHYQKIKNADPDSPTGVHFSRTDHRGTADIRLYVLAFCPLANNSDASNQWRLRVELDWIRKLRTQSPHGLNLDF